jgi:hypothetical protein
MPVVVMVPSWMPGHLISATIPTVNAILFIYRFISLFAVL